MYAELLGLLLFACQIILNESSFIVHENVTTAVTSETPSATFPEGYVTFSDVNAVYKLHEVSKTWNEARDLCVAEGAHLAIADTEKKIAHITSLRTRHALKWTHVGIHRANNTDQWVRIDNDLSLTSLPWLADNPNGDGDCVGIAIWRKVLLDYECDVYKEWFACEIPL